MSSIEYSSIEHLIASQEHKGSSVAVKFRCEASGVETDTSASVRRGQGIKDKAVQTAKRSMWSSLQRAVSGAIRDAVGSGTVGRIARDAAGTVVKDKQKATEFSKAEVQAAIVTAFTQVQAKFKNEDGRWVGVVAPATPFATRLAEAPVSEQYDQGILSRALVELSCADGTIGDEERAFLGDFIDPALGTIDELAQREKLSAAELEETTESVRSTILMLAWACAACDEEIAAAESTRLNELASGLGIEVEAAAALRRDAQQFMFDQALSSAYAEGKRNDAMFAEAMEAAGKMGIDAEDAEKFDVKFRKRSGIV